MFNIANVIQTAGFMVLIKVTYPTTHGKVSQWLLAACCSPRPAPQGLMGAPGVPHTPKWGRVWGTGGSGAPARIGVRGALCSPGKASPCAQPEAGSRLGWHARKRQRGAFPRDIVQKEPRSGALGSELSHGEARKKINSAVRLRGGFAPEAASGGAPRCHPRCSQRRGCFCP